ncbi:MAG: PfkB family carbohydrate kinase, partial [Actinomycetota bacterium]|nr:PfkB family carbohydrate kinase [Actinomycetota bacterium]
MTRVLVVGDLVTDVVVTLPGPVNPGSDTEAGVQLRGGGAGANTACWLAECGVDAALVARVGGDEIGRARNLELLGAGVDAVVAIDHDARTGTIVVLVGPDGERTMLTDRGASALLSPRDVECRRYEPGGHLHLSGYTLFDYSSHAAGRHALDLAWAAGMSVSVDASSAAPLRRAGAAAFVSWTRGADMLLANAEEAEILTGHAEPAAAAAALATEYPIAVVKAGAAGAIWAGAGRVVHCPARPAAVV